LFQFLLRRWLRCGNGHRESATLRSSNFNAFLSSSLSPYYFTGEREEASLDTGPGAGTPLEFQVTIHSNSW
jgi:hypothetical protein